ncbi:MAG: D-tyrosyl-tRNA(Tyr) deacylase [Oscillospiraceae bacterium]|jgi:D-tyrosyl-tRNA(Tyr) deacylase|nr:D-tyrosyl-tRNA(Tyr) deacylase [Oscillospiraceae bacterium]
MRAVIQRVSSAACECEGAVTGEIGGGFAVFLGVHESDTEQQADYIAKKIANMRIFCDEDDKMNLSLSDCGGEILLISQFTLYGDCSHGNRPYFAAAARPEKAVVLYEYVISLLRDKYKIGVKTGVFGGKMRISLVNEGPVTIILDTEEMRKK